MRFYFILILSIVSLNGVAQTLNNLRQKLVPVLSDTLLIDTLSIVPNSLFIQTKNYQLIASGDYRLNEPEAKLVWINKPATDSVYLYYRVFSFSLSRPVYRKETALISQGTVANPFVYQAGDRQPDFYKFEGLNRSGSISRGISFGNNQDVFVNSSLNLQLSGKLSDRVEILAAITDENIPVQPEGNTQQLQDFDKVFIQLSDENNKLIAGDFELRRPDSYFMNFFKKGQGGYYSGTFKAGENPRNGKQNILRTGASLAISKGKFTRNTITPVEGNQGPYRLQGTNGEVFIIILAGTEKIYLDGQLLERGLEHDYIIDYNTAELSFTTRRLITKDSRIVAEFEYSDKNYSRSLLFFNQEYETDRVKLKFNVYSEQDSKNQPLLQDLDSARTAKMASLGDNIQEAFFPTGDSVEFNSDQVLYQRMDTITGSGTFSIFRYSTNPDSAYWRVTFTEVGNNKGDYILQLTSANGRVFKWVEPLSGIPQGNYTPNILLITPKKQQLFTLGGDFLLNKNNKLSVEAALSNNDINLFSNFDKGDDAGSAFRLLYKNNLRLSADSVEEWKLNTEASYEYAAKNFQPVERYRAVEFERDWNLGSATVRNDEHITGLQTTLSRKNSGSLSYQLRSYLKGEDYTGWMNALSTNWKAAGFSLNGSGSYLNTSGISNRTGFLRHQLELSRPVWKVIAGVKENHERNKFKTLASDTLQANSAGFQEWMAYVKTADTSANTAQLSYKWREDRSAFLLDLVPITRSEEVTLSTSLNKNPKNSLRTTSTYRKLNVQVSTRTSQLPAETFLNRLDHQVRFWKGVLILNTSYEVGNGQERKQEYYYLEVPAGQGVYAYIADLNGNGVKDLDEFAVASFQDQARYIRIFVPTNQFITIRNNQFSEILTINPAARSSSYRGKEKFINRWSDQLSVRLDKKSKGESILASLNPFDRSIEDSLLVSANSSIRNSVYFNRNNPVYGADYTIQSNRNKSILTNGFEYRTLTSRTLNTRWNINRKILMTLALEQSEKENRSEFFASRDYRILAQSVEPKISYQPGSSFRATASYKFQDKKNSLGSGGEKSESDRFGIEIRYTTVNAGSMTGKVNLVNVRYNAPDNSFLSYELLEGLKSGRNFTWNLSLQRNLSTSMQLSLNYDGRKLQDSKTVHTGGVQFRAFF